MEEKKTSGKFRTVIVVLALLIITAAAGLAAGAYLGYSRARGYFGSSWLDEQCLDVRSRLVLLDYLNSGEAAKAAEMLEDQMDDDLVSIEPDKFISRRTVDNVNQTIAEARAYRARRPRTSKRPIVDKMVENLFTRPPF